MNFSSIEFKTDKIIFKWDSN